MSYKAPVTRVREVMKKEVDILDGMLTVAEALRVMKNPDTRTLIIDKRHDDDEYGVVMFSDIARKVLARDRSPDRINLYEIMSKPILFVDPTMDIRYATRMIARFGLSRIPVVDHGKIVGLISYTDVVLKGLVNNPLETQD
ncbi:MAG TPA: CBS domain-containing protein [Xanthomonadales bacterium]|nr:CBS domain-containing protein [Xanthomonadales bacterium]